MGFIAKFILAYFHYHMVILFYCLNVQGRKILLPTNQKPVRALAVAASWLLQATALWDIVFL